MASLRLDGVRKAFTDKGREHVVVHDLTLSVADGEFLVLVGPSGCGKSTTLRMIAGLEGVTAGTISIGDRVVTDVPAKDRDIAMVFQNYALYPHMTVRRNLAFALELRKLPPAEIGQRVDTTAEMLGLGELLERKPRQLSGGQRQRVALGRAIVRNPQVFLFDEPLSNLDAKLRVQMRRQLAALRRRLGTTTVYVTHDQVEAMTLGDRIVVMKDGRVQQAAGPLDLYARPANTFVATFMGSPPMNLIRGTISVAGGAAVFEAAAGDLRLPLEAGSAPSSGNPVILGVRPEGWSHGAAGLTGMVMEVEPLGNESFAQVDLMGTEVTVRVDGASTLRRGDRLPLTVLPEARHWFDGRTEDRLS